MSGGLQIGAVIKARATLDRFQEFESKITGPELAGPLKLAGIAVQNSIRDELGKKQHKKGTPTNSEPGEPPSLVTGSLRRSIQVGEPAPKGFGSWYVQVGPTMSYSRVQELGGGKSNLPARPYVAPGFDRSRPEVRRILSEYWERATR